MSNIRIVEWSEPPILGRAERLNSILKPGYVPFYYRARRWIRQALKDGIRFDVVHQPVPVAMRYPSPAANLGLPLVIGPVGGGLNTPPGFTGEDNSAPWYSRLRNLDRHRLRWDPLLRRTYTSADCVLGIAGYVEEQLSAVPVRRFEVMSETGIDIMPPPIIRSGQAGPLKLLYAGRLIRTKGAQDIINAMSLLRELPVELAIVGDGPDRRECEALIASLGLSERVSLVGWRPKDELPGFYRNADVFVFPSYREAGGNVALEAMSFSLPLIVVDRGGPGSATSDLCAIKLGISTPDALAVDIAAAIRRLAVNPDLRTRMGAASYMHATQTALWSAKLDRMDSIYADLIDNDRAGTAMPGLEKQRAGVEITMP
ncbi:glycosyltransferase [Rhizobium sp. Root1220]|nr:glycosyltransferase [Rhizobium sp. Root1220]